MPSRTKRANAERPSVSGRNNNIFMDPFFSCASQGKYLVIEFAAFCEWQNDQIFQIDGYFHGKYRIFSFSLSAESYYAIAGRGG